MKYIRYRKGLIEVLNMEGVAKLVEEHTSRIADAAGDGFVGDCGPGKTRYRGTVYPDTWSARRRNFRENILLKKLG